MFSALPSSTLTGLSQVIVILVAGVVLLAVPLVVRYLVGVARDVREIKGVLITPAPTLLIPKPPKGLIDVVAGLVLSQTASLAGTATLLKDSKPDDGTTSRDVLNRIEGEQDRLRGIVPH